MLQSWPRLQNTLLLTAGFYFTWSWDWRLLCLLAFVTGSTFLLTILLEKQLEQKKKSMAMGSLLISLAVILGVLLTFKYANFFIESFCDVFGVQKAGISLKLFIPMGISFYSFMAIGYVIDVYRRKIKVSRNILDFSLFLCFMPLIAAGPIERADRLLPQIASKRTFCYDSSVEGFMICCYGFFKKLVIADRLKWYVDNLLIHEEYQNSVSVFISMLFYTIQIYCDFSAYSDIARGSSKLLGFDIMENFKFPYISTSIKDFWKRWHISLSTWFRDYVYFPLGGSRVNAFKWARNILIVFLLSGLWHGANWTFIVWGGIHGVWMLFEYGFKCLLDKLELSKLASGWTGKTLGWLCTMGIVSVAWVFFRAQSVSDAFRLLAKLFLVSKPYTLVNICAGQGPFYMLISVLVIVFGIGSDYLVSLYRIPKIRSWLPMVLSVFWLLCVIFLGVNSDARFIYVQF